MEVRQRGLIAGILMATLAVAPLVKQNVRVVVKAMA